MSAAVELLARRLDSADLLVGVARVPRRVLETLWVEEEGLPDALWVSLSSGFDFTVKYEGEAYRVYEGDWRLDEDLEVTLTGLSRTELNELGRQLAERHAENMAGVDR